MSITPEITVYVLFIVGAMIVTLKIIAEVVSSLDQDKLKLLAKELRVKLPSSDEDILKCFEEKNLTSDKLKKVLTELHFDDVIQRISEIEKYSDDDEDDDKDDDNKNSNTSTATEAACQPKKNSGHTFNNGYLIITGIIIVLLAAIYMYPKHIPLFSSKHSYQNVEEFEKEMNEARSQFPNQYEFYFKILTNVGKRHLEKVENEEKGDLRPMSFLIAGYDGSRETMDCFLSKLGHAYTHEEYATIHSEEFIGGDSKLNFDKKIIASLKDAQKFVIIKDVDKLEFETAQLFMTYSDAYSDVSSYPQSAIILTTNLPFPYDPNRSRHDDEGEVGAYFRNSVWKGKDTNNVAALWTRVGDGLILLKPEKTNPCLQS